MDTLSTAMNIFGGYYESDRGWRHYRVEGKPYDIQFNARTLEWKCTCPHYIFRKAQCKHIKKYKITDKKDFVHFEDLILY